MRVLLVLGFFAAKAWGCSCAGSPVGNPACQSAWQHDAVFTETVMDITQPGLPIAPLGRPFPQRRVRLRIAEAFVGLDPQQREIVIETGLGGGDCGYGFQQGFDSLVYAFKKPDGVLSTGICSPTRPLA